MPLRKHLPEHSVDTVAERGWSDLDNGARIEKVEQEGYEWFRWWVEHIRVSVLGSRPSRFRLHCQRVEPPGWRGGVDAH